MKEAESAGVTAITFAGVIVWTEGKPVLNAELGAAFQEAIDANSKIKSTRPSADELRNQLAPGSATPASPLLLVEINAVDELGSKLVSLRLIDARTFTVMSSKSWLVPGKALKIKKLKMTDDDTRGYFYKVFGSPGKTRYFEIPTAPAANAAEVAMLKQSFAGNTQCRVSEAGFLSDVFGLDLKTTFIPRRTERFETMTISTVKEKSMLQVFAPDRGASTGTLVGEIELIATP